MQNFEINSMTTKSQNWMDTTSWQQI